MVSIAELRARNGKMSQKELAKKIGVTQATVSFWEKDPLAISGRNIKKISIYFGVSADELLDVKLK